MTDSGRRHRFLSGRNAAQGLERTSGHVRSYQLPKMLTLERRVTHTKAVLHQHNPSDSGLGRRWWSEQTASAIELVSSVDQKVGTERKLFHFFYGRSRPQTLVLSNCFEPVLSIPLKKAV